MNPFGLKHRGGRLAIPGIYWFFERLKASWVNNHWVGSAEFDEIQRGN